MSHRSKPVIPWDDLQHEARRRWGRSTPFRLGILVGERGKSVPSPYLTCSSAHQQFQKGIVHAMRAEVHA